MNKYSFRHLQVNSQLVRGNYLIAELDDKTYTINIDRGTVREAKLNGGKEVSLQEAHRLLIKAIGVDPILKHFTYNPVLGAYSLEFHVFANRLKDIIDSAVDGNLRNVFKPELADVAMSIRGFKHDFIGRALNLGSVLEFPAFKPAGSESLTSVCNRAREEWALLNSYERIKSLSENCKLQIARNTSKSSANKHTELCRGELDAAKESCRTALDETFYTGERIMDVSKTTTDDKPQTLDEVCKVSQARWEYARANERVARLKEYAEAIANAPSKDDIKLMDIIDERIGTPNHVEPMSGDALKYYRELHADARKYDIGHIVKKKDGTFTTLDKESDKPYVVFNRQDKEELINIEFSFPEEIGYTTYELALLKLESGKLEVVSIGKLSTTLGRFGYRLPHFSVANLMSLWQQVRVGDIIEPEVLMVQTV